MQILINRKANNLLFRAAHKGRMLFLFSIFLFISSWKVHPSSPTAPSKKTIDEAYLKSFFSQETDKDLGVADLDQTEFVAIKEFWELLSENNDDTLAPNDYPMRELLVKLLSNQMLNTSHPVSTNMGIWQDTRVLGSRHEADSSMLHKLFPSYTLTGQVFRALALIHWPTSDPGTIHRRQALIQKIIELGVDFNALEETFNKLKSYEIASLAFFGQASLFHTKEIRYLVKQYQEYPADLWQISSTLDNSFGWMLLAFSAIYNLTIIWDVASPLCPIKCCSCMYCLNYGYFLLQAGIITAGYVHHFAISSHNQRVNKLLYQMARYHIDGAYHYLLTLLGLDQQLDLPGELKLGLSGPEIDQIISFFMDAKYLMLNDPEAQSQYLYETIPALDALHKMKELIARLIHHAGMLDLYFSVAKRMSLPEAGTLSFATLHPGGPYIHAHGIWNPMLDGSTAITNDIQQGDSSSNTSSVRSLIITGANASGKSTLMRAITINALFLAQTLGVVAAESYEGSLFHAVQSYMDKIDPPGDLSSYQAELDHATSVLNQVASLSPGENMLTCFDELFSTTNPGEGLQASKVMLQALAEQPQLMAIVSSHYEFRDFLKRLEEDFAIKHMVSREANGEVVYTYQMEEGVNKDKLGLRILAEQLKAFPAVVEELKMMMENQEND